MNIADWLRSLELAQYEQAFLENDIDGDVLLSLTAEDLGTIGVTSIGHRRKLLDAIAGLGAGMASTAPSAATAAEPAAGMTRVDRRLLTVMFADLVGSTALSARLDPEDVREIIGAYHRCCSEVIVSHGGYISRFMGDGILAYFGFPEAHEDDAERAVRSVLLLVNAVSRLETGHGGPLQARVGIATGIVVVGDLIGKGEAREHGAVGDAPNLAARLQGVAEPGQVVILQATRRLAGGLFEYRDLGHLALAGYPERVQAWHVLKPSPVDSRFEARREINVALQGELLHRPLIGPNRTRSIVTWQSHLSPFVGRARELEMLDASFPKAAGWARVIEVVGEPGIGKSRLLHEFQRRLVETRVFILSGSCWPDGTQTPFRPFIEVVRRSFRLGPDDTEAEVTGKINTGLAVLGLAAEENLGFLLNLLGLKPRDGTLHGLDEVLIGLRTRDLLLQLLRQRSRFIPVVMVLEDIQWIDRASQDLLAQVVEVQHSGALVILHTRRPEYQPPWVAGRYVTTLRLEPLAANETSTIIRSRLGVTEFDRTLVQLIVNRAEGNPLFAEEIANFLVEGSMAPRGIAPPTYDAAAVAAALPASLQSLLIARVDRLPPGDRSLLQAASVMGRYFVSDVLAAVTALPDVNARLAAMQKLDLIHLDKGSGEFHFKHALVRDALYAGLLTGLRRTLHFKIAAEIERRNANRLVEVVEILAHHYSQSGCTDKAVEFLALSGAKSLGINSLDEAEQFLRTGLVLARSADPARMDPQVAGMLVDLAKTLRLKFQANQIIRLLEPELTKIEALGEIEAVPILLNFYAVALFQVCRFLEGKRVQNKALALAERLQDDKSLAYSRTGHLLLSTVIDPLPLREFARFAEQALRESERTEDIYLIGWTIWVVAWNYVHRGLKVEGHELATRLMKRGQESRDPRSIGAALWLFGWLDILVENYASALANGEECVQRALTPFDRQIGYLIVGSAKLLMGQITEGFETIKRWRDESLANGYHYTALATEVPFSVGMALSGEFKKGVRWLEGVIERCETQYCYQFYADFARLHLAEMYLALLRPKKRPPLQLLLKNPMFLMYARVMARWKAEELLNAASRNKTFSNEGVFRARIDFDFAQLYIATNKLDLARKHLERARMVAARQNAFPLIARVDAAMAAL